MAAKKRNDDNDEFNEELDLGMDAAEPIDFYQSEVTRYAATVDRDLNEAFKRYGFTLYHSLPPLKQLQLSQKLGFMGTDAVDHFNLAGVEILDEKYDKAAKLLQKSLELDGTFADAAYNLALCYEKLGKPQDALNQWSRYQELSQSEDDSKLVEAHVTELRG